MRHRIPGPILVLWVVALVCARPCVAGTLYVNPAGGGDATTITAAIAAAAEGDTILVAPGTYTEKFTVSKGLHFRADEGGEVVMDGSTAGNPPITFYCYETTGSVTIHGFTFRNGFSPSGHAIAFTRAAGVAEVHDCTFADITSDWVSPAIYANDTEIDIRRCTFENVNNTNALCHAGAVYIVAVAGGTANLIDCAFSNCTSAGGGGAAHFADVGPATISGCTFENCLGSYGGALIFTNGIVHDCTFTGNQASGNGGGIFASLTAGTCEIHDCILEGNSAGGLGGGIYAQQFGDSELRLHHALIVGGSAEQGGGLCTSVSTALIESNTFALNEASTSGAAIHCEAGTQAIHHCIFYKQTGAAAIHAATAPTVGCSAFWENIGGHGSGGLDPLVAPDNIEVDPRFCDRTAGDYQLALDSPCAPGNLPVGCADLIGVYGTGCDQTPTEPISWGRLRRLFE